MMFWVWRRVELVGRWQRLGETYLLSSSSVLKVETSLHGAKTRKNNVIILTVLKTSNLTSAEWLVIIF
jgi:hypothetical protein